MNVMKRALFLAMVVSTIGTRLSADSTNVTPLPGDGTTASACDVASAADQDKDGKTQTDTLRQRIELYNKKDASARCFFYIFFLYRNKEIVLKAPLVLENNPHDRNEGKGTPVNTGTYISGYGPGGETDHLGITIDARNVTKDATKCAFVIKGGFGAEQQIHGLTILVTNGNQAICDENGEDLMEPTSPYCDGTKKGRDCDFKDVSVLYDPTDGGSQPPEGEMDKDADGVIDNKDLCPGDPVTGGEAGNYGCPNTKCVYFTPGLIFRPPFSFLKVIAPPPSRPLLQASVILFPRSKPVVKDKTGKDLDGDGIDDACDLVNNSPDPCIGADTDGDGTADVCDDDIDGDGLPNRSDPNPYDDDTDGDGVKDGQDPCPFDKDVTPNPDGACGFEDSDRDGLSKDLEGVLGTDPNKADTDGDGFSDGIDCLPLDPEHHECQASAVTPPSNGGDGGGTPAPGGETPPANPEPSASTPPAVPQGCGLQLVPPNPKASQSILPYLTLLASVVVIRAARRRENR